jgi:hypothetical protein
MTRLIAVVILIFILRLAVKSFSGQLKAAVFGQVPGPKQPPQVAETLVPCTACGTYVAASRTLKGAGEGEVFCSEECRRGKA